MNLNKALIIGRITQDLELKSLNSGTKVLNFSVATNYVYKDAGGNKVEQTEFHNVVSFGKQAEIVAQYFAKGQEIFVEGRLQTRSWDDQTSGKKMYRTEILLEKFEFGAKPNGTANNNYQSQQNQAQEPKKKEELPEIEYPDEDINPEDIPF